MKKKNGFTSIELLVSFIIVSSIVIGLFDVVLNYKNKQQIASYKTTIQSYINEMTKLVQDDLIHRKLKAATISGSQVVLSFELPKEGSTTSQFVVAKAGRYLQYGKVGEEVKYPIPNIADFEIASYKLKIEQQFLVIEVVFSHPNFSNEKQLKITCPINYVK